MSKRLGAILGTILGAAVFAGTVWGLFLLARSAAGAFGHLDDKMSAGLLAAFTTIVVSVVSVLLAKSIERKRAIELELRAKKTPFYEQLIDLVFKFIFAEKLGSPMLEKDSVKALTEMTKNLVIWGSPEVLKSFSQFRKLTVNADASKVGAGIMLAVEDIFRAIRKDLGHDDSRVRKGEILRLFINDIDKHL